MTEKSKSGLTEPRYKRPGIFYRFLIIASKIIQKILNIEVDTESVKRINEINSPVLFLGPHNSAVDFVLAVLSAYPRRLSFVASANIYYSKPWGALLRMSKFVIPKMVFTADYHCVRSIKKMIEAGVSVSIFPEGRFSLDSKESYIAPSIAKLIKWLDVPVVVMKTEGSYLAMPPYIYKLRKGKIKVSVSEILNANEIKDASITDIMAKLKETITHDDFDYQEREHVAFKAKKNAAEGLADMLYLCPRCGKEFVMKNVDNELFCTECGNRFRLDEYGVLTALGDSVGFNRIDKWYNYQKCEVKKVVLADLDYSYSEDVELWINDPSLGDFKKCDSGRLTLTEKGFKYEGKGDYSSLTFPITGSPYVSVIMGKCLNLFNDNTIYRFITPHAIKFNIVNEQLYLKAKGEF